MVSIFAVATTGLATGGINEAVGHPVKSCEESERLRVGSRVTLAYATCKTMWIAEVDKEKGMVVLGEGTAKSARKTKMNIDTNGIVFKEYDPVAYSSPWPTKPHLTRILPDMFRNTGASVLSTRAQGRD